MSLVVFDFDGTLIDSANTVLKIINIIRVSDGKAVLQKKDLTPWISFGGKDLIKNALEIDNELIAEHYLDKFRKMYFQELSSPNDIFPYAVDFIYQLKVAGIKLAICTNKPRLLLDKILIELSLAQYFDYIVAGGDLPTQKPNPDNILICNDVLQVPIKDTILIGDSTVDQKMADAAQIKFCMYQNGYDDGVNLRSASAVIESYETSFEVIKNILEAQN